jgi:hypothetical protein
MFHLMLAVASFAALLSAFRALDSVTDTDYALFLFCGLFPILLAIAFPIEPQPNIFDAFGNREHGANLLRGLCCASAELVMLSMAWSRMLASECEGTLHSLATATPGSTTGAPGPSLPFTDAYYLLAMGLPNVVSSLLLLTFACVTYLVVYYKRYARAWHWLLVWHLLMWADLQIWFYSLHREVFH